MSGGSALNLSLLSRGIGEVSRNGHEKVEVVFEPEDYFNWANNPERMLRLPAIPQQQRQAFSKTLEKHFDYAKAENLAYVHVPKTFTTRKGALLLFSEDLATKTTPRNMQDRKQHLVTHSMDDFDLRTVDDLAKSILSYGKDENADGMYLGFVHPRRWYRETRRIRPGFSAKRYLSTWTQSWDDALLHKLLDKGYMTEGSIQQVSFIPNKRVRLYDDLSNCPRPLPATANHAALPWLTVWLHVLPHSTTVRAICE
ncbi:uncharacterized protein KIAA2012 homolog [Liolophura sinensis]|uniref:uncharacterized protein KIAA2012 homolog n=1 Tax=Liolophura sinensis TaxID=3198878 RepID=UPI003158C4B3